MKNFVITSDYGFELKMRRRKDVIHRTSRTQNSFIEDYLKSIIETSMIVKM